MPLRSRCPDRGEFTGRARLIAARDDHLHPGGADPGGLAVTVNTADAASVETAVRRAVDRYTRIDVVFNNAGIACAQQPLHEPPVEDWRTVRGIDGDGIFYVM